MCCQRPCDGSSACECPWEDTPWAGVLLWVLPHVGRAGQAWHKSCERGT